ncbi:MAG: type II toxin-antitoxin system VapC family toxin [Dehalococcoidia bacterium]
MTGYLDASSWLRAVLRDGPLLPEWADLTITFSSEIVLVEVHRVVDRLRLTGALSPRELAEARAQLDELERSVNIVPIDEDIIELARSPLPTPLRALDSIHVATALILRDDVGLRFVFATHDRQQATAARALGFEVVGVEF